MTSDNLVEHLSGLIGSAAAVVGEVDLQQVLRRLVSEARTATGARYAALGVLGAHGVLKEFIHEGLDESEVARIGALPQGRGVLGIVVREKRTVVLDDLSQHPGSYGFPEGHPVMTSFLGVPVRAGDSTYGNLYLTDKPGGFDAADVELVEALAVIAGSAVNTARLRDRLSAMALVEDRDRIARDLHDSIIQDLFAIGLSLQGLSERVHDTSTSGILIEAVDRLDGAVETLRRYIYELKTSDNLRRAFAEQLVDLVERMSSAYPVEVSLNASGLVAEIDPDVAEEALKMVTEAVSNALRHSGADVVEVTAEQRPGELVLTIRDDGGGFDVEARHDGLGLKNMRDRVRRMGGEIEIQSSQGLGTSVVIRMPTG